MADLTMFDMFQSVQFCAAPDNELPGEIAKVQLESPGDIGAGWRAAYSVKRIDLED